MAMYYADWVNALGGYLPENVANTNTEAPFTSGSRYNAVIDRCIEYAELRMYRDPDLDFLATREFATSTCTAGTRSVTLPTGMVVVEEANLVIPAGQAPNSAGSSFVPLEITSVAFLNRAWGVENTQQQPSKFARANDTQIILGANPDQAYVISFYGTMRPTALSSSNTSTFLTLNLPDLFLAASMIWMSMYQKSLGAVQSVGPLEGVTWEEQYQNMKKGAAVEEARKKSQSSAWSPMAPTAAATPPRA
jgi:hypothetical protein